MSRLIIIILAVICCGKICYSEKGPVRSGPLVGYVDNNEALIWIDLAPGSRIVEVIYFETNEPTKQDSVWKEKPDSDTLPITILLKPLKSGVQYLFKVRVDGKEAVSPYQNSFRTPFTDSLAQHAEFSFLLGSCLYLNDGFEKKDYGSDAEILSTMSREPSDFMLWTGDNVYLRPIDYGTREGILRRYFSVRRNQKLQPVISSRANFATWDDHDFGPNDCNKTFKLASSSLEIFKLFWPNKHAGQEDNPGVYHSFTWNDCEFFMLDDRYHRSPGDMPGLVKKVMNKEKKYFGEKQLDWLKKGLSESKATFKFIIAGGQMLNPMAEKECLRYYNYEYNELIGHILLKKIDGVVFISGDRHFSELIATQPKGGYTLFEFTCSSLTSEVRNIKKSREFENPYRVSNTLLMENNFGKITVSGEPGNRKLNLQTIDSKGKKVWEFPIAEKELKFTEKE